MKKWKGGMGRKSQKKRINGKKGKGNEMKEEKSIRWRVEERGRCPQLKNEEEAGRKR